MVCFATVSHHFYTNMASYARRGDTWRASVCRKGIRRTATFPSKAAAVAWAGRIEADILAGERGEIPNKTFSELLDRYGIEVSAKKKGARWEAVRIALLQRDALAGVRLRVLGGPDVAAWRDRRLQAVSEASVRREWNLLSHACSIAVREWRWLKANPFAAVRRPKPGQARNRLMSSVEREKILAAAVTPIYTKVVRAMDFAVETGMRAGEICGLTRDRIDGRVAALVDTKNGTRREVPLSPRAIEILGECRDDPVFGLTSGALDVHWRNLVKVAGIVDLHFHDLRHTAITRLVHRLNPLELAKMVGHKDLKMLLVYYNESAADIAKKL